MYPEELRGNSSNHNNNNNNNGKSRGGGRTQDVRRPTAISLLKGQGVAGA